MHNNLTTTNMEAQIAYIEKKIPYRYAVQKECTDAIYFCRYIRSSKCKFLKYIEV